MKVLFMLLVDMRPTGFYLLYMVQIFIKDFKELEVVVGAIHYLSFPLAI